MKEQRVRVRVRLKEGILDPESEVIFQQLHSMEFSSLQSLEKEKSFILGFQVETESEAIDLARKAAQQLLSNVVMESFEVESLT